MGIVKDIRNSKSESSKKIVALTGLFVASQIYLTMALVCIFPTSAPYLNPICLSCIAGYLTVASWYYSKASKENQLKIAKSMDAVLNTIKDVSDVTTAISGVATTSTDTISEG